MTTNQETSPQPSPCHGEGDRLAQQLRFLAETDKIKHILRRNRLLDGSRYENDAEHTWSIALMAMTLVEYAARPVDLLRVLKMLLIHDIVEIDAGDTFPYGTDGVETQHEREAVAAERIFGLLPPDMAEEYRALWDEFEAKDTPEAQYAMSIDRLGGVIPNFHNDGGGWRENDVPIERILERNMPIGKGAPALGDLACRLIEETAAAGRIKRLTSYATESHD